jgi:hypothetical protein
MATFVANSPAEGAFVCENPGAAQKRHAAIIITGLFIHSRVPLSLLNPDAEIPMFCVPCGMTANFVMVPKFEESARNSPRGLVLLPASTARNAG